MRLNAKATLASLILGGVLAAVLVVTSLLAFRQFSIVTAQEHVRTAAEVVRVSLTESMINGVIDKREQFLQRLSAVPGVIGARVIRGEAVVRQFGPGLGQEEAIDQTEMTVLQSGIPSFILGEKGDRPTFSGIIPFVADGQGRPNCLECHHVIAGTVLGAISITLALDRLQEQALTTIGVLSGVVIFFALLLTLLLRRLIAPVVTTAQEVQQAVAHAKQGLFTERLESRSNDEVGQIAKDLNELMSFLQENLGGIGHDAAHLIGYDAPPNTNLITYATEMVRELTAVAQFKQSIEEDLTKREVYARIGRVLTGPFSLQRHTLYEVAASQNHMRVASVDGDLDAPIRWCEQQILYQAEHCRAQRTGRIIDSQDDPHICAMFRGRDDSPPLAHICLPVIHGGSVGSVVQLVFERRHGHLTQLMVPFIKAYLRESAPVVEAKRLLATLKENALRDALTGLHNRRFLEEYVETMLAGLRRKEGRLSVLMLDFDHFKQVNDTFGHDAGDTALKTLAKVLQQQVRASDLVIRYGGEEFLVVLQETEEYTGMAVAEKIRLAVEAMKIPIAGGALQKTVSIGAARYPTDSDDFWEVSRMADQALYQAKAQGRNRCIEYAPPRKGGGDAGAPANAA
ncbi:MAG: diguanylate cyclase [Magnetococcales bacterium]|nr:diguanylate cyclase [Magnetococcales bacterium]